jgi:predicted TIM-barrel fold metal-dependent hydrolase
VADPEQNWLPGAIEGHWGYSDGTYPTWQEHYDQVFAVLNRHPKLNTTFAHFFFYEDKPTQLAEIFERYENVGVDVVPGLMFSIFMKKPEFYREFLTKYADRIIYGSDWAVLQDSNEFGEALMDSIYDSLTTEKESNIWGNIVKGIALPQVVTDKILYKNFKRKCHNEPKPINKKALKAYIEKYKDYIRDLESKEQILKFAETL